MPGTSKALGKGSIRALIAAAVFLVAWPLALSAHLTALGIVFLVLFGLSVLATAVLVGLTVRKSQAELNEAMREDAELRNHRLNG